MSILKKTIHCECGFKATGENWAVNEWIHEGCPRCDCYNFEKNISPDDLKILSDRLKQCYEDKGYIT